MYSLDAEAQAGCAQLNKKGRQHTSSIHDYDAGLRLEASSAVGDALAPASRGTDLDGAVEPGGEAADVPAMTALEAGRGETAHAAAAHSALEHKVRLRTGKALWRGRDDDRIMRAGVGEHDARAKRRNLGRQSHKLGDLSTLVE